MTEAEALDYYNENWNDYDKIVDMLHDIFDSHADDMKMLEKKLSINNEKEDSSKKIQELKTLLQQCQDKLDEETHKLN